MTYLGIFYCTPLLTVDSLVALIESAPQLQYVDVVGTGLTYPEITIVRAKFPAMRISHVPCYSSK